MPKNRIEEIPAGDADADDRSDQDLPEELREAAEPPAERQDLSEEELREFQGANTTKKTGTKGTKGKKA